jgi:DNA-binding response OmpR family regulator
MENVKKILVASSSYHFLDRNKHLLDRSHLRVLTATTGMEALRLHREEPVDLIVTEMHLDDMTGDEFCSLFRREERQRNVAVVLAYPDTPVECTRAEKSAADICLKRPIHPVQLLQAVEQLLEGVNILRDNRTPIKVRVLSRKQSIVCTCLSYNISVTGIMLETDEHLNMGERITCEFSFSGALLIETKAEVIRSLYGVNGKQRYGVHFIDLAPEFCREIDQYVANVASEVYQ